MILRVFPYAALNYMCYEQYKALIIGTDPKQIKEHPLARQLAGALAGTKCLFAAFHFFGLVFLSACNVAMLCVG
jgi:hypothetical protein